MRTKFLIFLMTNSSFRLVNLNFIFVQRALTIRIEIFSFRFPISWFLPYPSRHCLLKFPLLAFLSRAKSFRFTQLTRILKLLKCLADPHWNEWILRFGAGVVFSGGKWKAICGRAANKNSLKFCIFIKLESDPRWSLGGLFFCCCFVFKASPFQNFLVYAT